MRHMWRVAIVLLLAVALAGCAPAGTQDASRAEFRQARDRALAYLKDVRPDVKWPQAYKWTSEDITGGRLGATVWRFTDAGGLSVVVSMPIIPTPIYNVEVTFGDFNWKGTVTGEGQVAEEETPPPVLLTPESARDAAVAEFLKTFADLKAPAGWSYVDASGGLLGVSAVRFLGDGWTVDVQAPVVPRPEYAVRVVHESGARWTGMALSDGSVAPDEGTTFLADDARPTRMLELVRADPKQWAGIGIRVVGYYEGWDLFGSVGTGPAVTKSDWVIRDDGGAIYVGGGNSVEGLNIPPSQKVEGVLLRLFAEVRISDAGQPYLWILQGSRIGAPGAALIEYQRTGGIAGFDDHLTIYADGWAALSQRGKESSLQLTQEQMDALKAAFAAANFKSLNETYLPADTCCDRFGYTVSYRESPGEEPHTVMVMDGTVPPELSPILEMLNRLVNEPK